MGYGIAVGGNGLNLIVRDFKHNTCHPIETDFGIGINAKVCDVLEKAKRQMDLVSHFGYSLSVSGFSLGCKKYGFG
jgi:hypothetical protein